MNYARTAMLLAAMTGLFLACGFMIAGEGGMLIALAIAVAMNFFAYWKSDTMVLRMYGARQVDAQSAPALHGIVAQLARQAGIPMPKVFIIENPQPNAFATGRNPENAAVAATTGLMRLLSQEEIAGVMAHELAHVKNRDTLIMTITATIAGALSMLANFAMFFGNNRNNPLGIVGVLLVAILAPLGAMIVQMAISRGREYEAWRIRHRQRSSRTQSGDGTHVHHQPPACPRGRQPVFHSPEHRKQGAPPARNGRRHQPLGLIPHLAAQKSLSGGV